jgi:predicted nucleic acid-binding protein
VAERGLYRPLWSEQLLAEARDAIWEIHPTIDEARIGSRFELMDETFEDACIDPHPDVEIEFVLPDPDDRHVVATAVVGRADAIVTMNVRDFPADAMDPLAIEIVHPDDFLLNQLDLAPRVILDVIVEQAAHATPPPLTPIDLVARLARAGVESCGNLVFEALK